MKRVLRLALLLAVIVVVACQPKAPPLQDKATPGPDGPGQPVTLTEVGTPRHETLIFQTFDRKTATPDQHNPLMAYAVWRGFRELGWGFLWETDTGTGKSYPELAADMPEPLNPERTKFRIKLKQGIYWSDGVEFTADDIIFTLDTMFKEKGKLTSGNVPRITRYVKSYQKVDKYTFEVETANPSYDLHTVLGVYTWASPLIPVPKHVFEKQSDVSAFRNTKPVTLGPYVVKEFDPNGFWQLWERRDDWQRSAWGWMGEPKPKYILYKDFGPEETRSLAFVQNQYDVDTFMSPDGIKAAQSKSPHIKTFSDKLPYHNFDDACTWGILINQHKSPLDKPEVRWALALSLNVKDIGITALNGEFKVSPLPMVGSQVLRPIYFEPLRPWLQDFALADGYRPFDDKFATDLAAKLKQMGVPAAQIPEGAEALSTAFGIGWWKHDPVQANKLLNSVGITKNASGVYTLPDGSVWNLDFVIPGDWNKLMQRVGFSIADNWRKLGINVNTRQVDNAEFGVVQNTNAQLEVMLNWTNCVFNPNYLNSWHSIRKDFLLPANSTERISGNMWRWDNATAHALIAESSALDQGSAKFYENGRAILKEFVKDMAYINIMDIPTAIPTNDYYWTGFPKQDNYYAVPYTWWSSAKEMVVNVKPTGRR
jgi:peptide/nickel transport system substrate-binding protein